jgi:long-subunit fatty acid transport protein
MNRSVKQALKGVSTFRVGFEYKPVPELAFRMGYNYVSPMYDKYGFRDPALQARGNCLSARTDFTNWRETNRVTAGLGYKFAKKWNLDIAYQFASTRGEFFPFATYTYHDRTDPNAANYDNIGTSARVKDIRSQFLMTLGYSF